MHGCVKLLQHRRDFYKRRSGNSLLGGFTHFWVLGGGEGTAGLKAHAAGHGQQRAEHEPDTWGPAGHGRTKGAGTRERPRTAGPSVQRITMSKVTITFVRGYNFSTQVTAELRKHQNGPKAVVKRPFIKKKLNKKELMKCERKINVTRKCLPPKRAALIVSPFRQPPKPMYGSKKCRSMKQKPRKVATVLF